MFCYGVTLQTNWKKKKKKQHFIVMVSIEIFDLFFFFSLLLQHTDFPVLHEACLPFYPKENFKMMLAIVSNTILAVENANFSR